MRLQVWNYKGKAHRVLRVGKWSCSEMKQDYSPRRLAHTFGQPYHYSKSEGREWATIETHPKTW